MQGDMGELTSRLVALIEDKLEKRVPARKPALRIVEAQPPRERFLDHVTRESHIKMIGHIRRRWGAPIQRIIDQACFGIGEIHDLSDTALVQLHRDMERAGECLREGITLEDANLLRSCVD